MARTKSKAAISHRRTKKLAKGFTQARRRRVKAAKEAVMHAGQYAYIGRKQKKRNLKSLWNVRLNAKAREHGLSYSQLISKLKIQKIEINRKILSEIAVKDSQTFKKIVDSIK